MTAITGEIRIREGVFETNSSSSHDLTISRDGELNLTFSKETLRNGVFNASTGDYGWEWHRYYLPEGKINYLVTGLFARENIDEDQDMEELKESNPNFAMLCDVVEKQTGVKLTVRAYEDSHIDHESSYEWQGAFENEETLRNFLFSPNSFVQTGNDNDTAPSHIETDRGPTPYYIEQIRPLPEDGTSIYVLVKTRNPNDNMFTTDGFPIPADAAEFLKSNAVGSGVVICKEKGRYDTHGERTAAMTIAMSNLKELGFNFSDPLPSMYRHINQSESPFVNGFGSELVIRLSIPCEKLPQYEAFFDRPQVISGKRPKP